MESDIDLAVIAAVLGLIISTVTVQFTFAKFVNEVRDGIVNKKPEGIEKISLLHDMGWGYLIAIAFNFIFLVIGYIVKQQTSGGELAILGIIVFWTYVGNFILWLTGSVLDFMRTLR